MNLSFSIPMYYSSNRLERLGKTHSRHPVRVRDTDYRKFVIKEQRKKHYTKEKEKGEVKGKEESNMRNETLKVLLFIIMHYKTKKCEVPKLMF
jgi:hypothetical protein